MSSSRDGPLGSSRLSARVLTTAAWHFDCKLPPLRACRRRPVSHINRPRLFVLSLLVLGLAASWPATAAAQRRGGRGPVVRSVVVVGGGAGYPRYPYYSPFFQWGPWGPYSYPYPYGFGYYGYGVRDELTSSVRLEVTPRNAEVYVDGYDAGKVDEYDGIFQRLRVRPGNHEIVLYLQGYRTVRQSLYFNSGSDQKVTLAMERLAAGETAEPPPPPSEPEPEDGPDRPEPRYGPGRPEPREAPPARERTTRFGTLSVRVQPGDAEILVDGERWSAPSDQERITIQLAEGRHHVEIRKAGYSQYSEDVLIRRDNTLTLNVSLLRGDAAPR